MENDQVEQIFKHIKENILTEDYNGENKIIETENVVFQVSTFEYQKNSMNPNISSIDLGECENILKKQYNISKTDSLLVIKTDIKSEDLSSTYVQYEIYHPITKIKLELKYCNEVKIIVNVPVNLDDSTISLYDSLSESGYNLFNSSDSFYNDICATYTSENGTDMLLEDRKNEIYSITSNISMCQTGCEFESYNKTTKKAKCNCDAQTNITETDITKITFENSVASSFLSTLTNSNFQVMKCLKLALNFSNILENKGRLIMTIIVVTFIALLLVYAIKDRKKINHYIQGIIKKKMKFYNNNKKKDKDKEKGKDKIDSNNNKDNKSKKERINTQEGKNKIKDINIYKKKNTKNSKKDKIKKCAPPQKKKNKDKKDKNDRNDKKDKHNKKDKKNKSDKYSKNDKNNKKDKNNKDKNDKNKENISFKNKNRNNTNYVNSNNNLYTVTNKNLKDININILPINLNYGKIQKKIEKKKETKNKNKNINKKKININKITSSIDIFKRHSISTEKETKNLNPNSKIEKEIYKNLNDQELNTLEYEFAIKFDKRTYFQYYWSLLKKKQLILFTFLPANDYNLLSLKISLLLLSFSLYFTINGFFFSDETMHKIHEDNGAFDIIFQIPQILYSSVVSAAINMILKTLSLSEKNILILKQQTDFKIAMKKSKSIENCLKIKFIIFFIISILLFLFFWYFITCFCAVYTNTQMILIKDTLFSFALSMLYPFGLNLLPGILRIPALRSKDKNKNMLYKISTIVALI